MKTRAEIWQADLDTTGSNAVSAATRILSGFQGDLNALRALSQSLKTCLPRVSDLLSAEACARECAISRGDGGRGDGDGQVNGTAHLFTTPRPAGIPLRGEGSRHGRSQSGPNPPTPRSQFASTPFLRSRRLAADFAVRDFVAQRRRKWRSRTRRRPRARLPTPQRSVVARRRRCGRSRQYADRSDQVLREAGRRTSPLRL